MTRNDAARRRRTGLADLIWSSPHTRRRLQRGRPRTGDHVGTPIITSDPDGEQPASFFGPVISDVPAPPDSVEFYRALETAARMRSFAELTRSQPETPRLPLLDHAA